MNDINTFLLDHCDNSQNLEALDRFCQQTREPLAPDHDGEGYRFSWGYVAEHLKDSEIAWTFYLPRLQALYEQKGLTRAQLQARVETSLQLHYPGYLDLPQHDNANTLDSRFVKAFPETGLFRFHCEPHQTPYIRQLIHDDLVAGLITHIITECYLYYFEHYYDEKSPKLPSAT